MAGQARIGGQRRRTRRLRQALFVVVATLVLAVGVAGAASFWVRRQVQDLIFRAVAEVPEREVALVLGGSVYRSGRPSPVVEQRLSAALSLLRAKKVRSILVSGDHRPLVYDEAEAMQRWLLRAGAAPAAVAVDREGLRTFDSVMRAAEVFGVRRAIVCTQAFHLPRSLFLARHAGIDAVGLQVGEGLLETDWRDLLRESLATVRALLDAHGI